jgi:outer membrane protein
MNRGLLILNIVLLVLVGVLFYLHFSSRNSGSSKVAGVQTSEKKNDAARIAYFEMDSINSNFNLMKEAENDLSKREQEMTNDLARMEKQIMDKVRDYQSQPLSQVQSEVATNDVRERQKQYEMLKGKYDQEFQQLFMNKKVEIRNKIEEYLKEYNKDGKYTYIFSYEPGFIFYRDTMYNITGDLIKGLNQKYPKKNNKK